MPVWIHQMLNALVEPTLWVLLPILGFQLLADRYDRKRARKSKRRSRRR